MEFKTPDVNATLSLMEIVKDGIQKLTGLYKHIHCIELELYEQVIHDQGSKFALCKIGFDKGSFTLHHNSSHYEDALLDTFDRACEYMVAI